MDERLLKNLQLCISSTGDETDWLSLYNKSFPADERPAFAVLSAHLASKKRLLHRSLSLEGELECFSIVSVQPTFVWLHYLASAKPGNGAGQLHLIELLSCLKEQYANATGLFFHVESATTSGIDEATREIRRRRINFYTRIGASRMPEGKEYVMPPFSVATQPIPAELIWFDFDRGAIDLQEVVKVMYQFLGLDHDDPLTKRIAEQF
jgi:hypothetical protein